MTVRYIQQYIRNYTELKRFTFFSALRQSGSGSRVASHLHAAYECRSCWRESLRLPWRLVMLHAALATLWYGPAVRLGVDIARTHPFMHILQPAQYLALPCIDGINGASMHRRLPCIDHRVQSSDAVRRRQGSAMLFKVVGSMPRLIAMRMPSGRYRSTIAVAIRATT